MTCCLKRSSSGFVFAFSSCPLRKLKIQNTRQVQHFQLGILFARRDQSQQSTGCDTELKVEQVSRPSTSVVFVDTRLQRVFFVRQQSICLVWTGSVRERPALPVSTTLTYQLDRSQFQQRHFFFFARPSWQPPPDRVFNQCSDFMNHQLP